MLFKFVEVHLDHSGVWIIMCQNTLSFPSAAARNISLKKAGSVGVDVVDNFEALRLEKLKRVKTRLARGNVTIMILS